jgi:hypothetical protein
MDTPWGRAEEVVEIASGILSVITPSHGGIILDATRTAAMPIYMSNNTFTKNPSTYEEDCDWAMPALVFETEFTNYWSNQHMDVASLLRDAKLTLCHCHPEAYEQFYGTTLMPGQSSKRDRQTFLEKHKENWLVAAAFGDWHLQVPKGKVGVSARLGSDHNLANAKTRFFLIADSEYKTHTTNNPFIVDLTRHEEIPPLK